MIVFALCLAGTALSYFIGVKNPGLRALGNTKGWIFALIIGACIASAFYAFSAFGLLLSLDSMLSDF